MKRDWVPIRIAKVSGIVTEDAEAIVIIVTSEASARKARETIYVLTEDEIPGAKLSENVEVHVNNSRSNLMSSQCKLPPNVMYL